jgi:hypothetical protein
MFLSLWRGAWRGGLFGKTHTLPRHLGECVKVTVKLEEREAVKKKKGGKDEKLFFASSVVSTFYFIFLREVAARELLG